MPYWMVHLHPGWFTTGGFCAGGFCGGAGDPAGTTGTGTAESNGCESGVFRKDPSAEEVPFWLLPGELLPSKNEVMLPLKPFMAPVFLTWRVMLVVSTL